MTMNPFEQSTQQLLRFLTSHAEWEVIDYIRQEIEHDAPESVPTADELLTFFRSPDAPTELDTYQHNVDDNGNVIPLETKEDVTYNVGLYLDPDGNAPS